LRSYLKSRGVPVLKNPGSAFVKPEEFFTPLEPSSQGVNKNAELVKSITALISRRYFLGSLTGPTNLAYSNKELQELGLASPLTIEKMI